MTLVQNNRCPLPNCYFLDKRGVVQRPLADHTGSFPFPILDLFNYSPSSSYTIVVVFNVM